MRFDVAFIVYKKKKRKSAAVHFGATDFCFCRRKESAIKVFFKVSEATRPPQTGYITTAITEGIMCLITSFHLKLIIRCLVKWQTRTFKAFNSGLCCIVGKLLLTMKRRGSESDSAGAAEKQLQALMCADVTADRS